MDIIKALQKEHSRIQAQAESLAAAINALDGAGNKSGPRHKSGRKKGWTMSASARRRISLAQKARWAKINK